MADTRLSTTTTRRTVLAAGLALPAAAAITILPEQAHAARATDDIDELSPLADFALAWLSCWTAQGGSVTVGEDGRSWLCIPMYEFSRAYVEMPDDLPATVRADQESFRDAHYHGRMRGMEAMLDAMPGGRDAVRLIVRACPILGLKPASEV